MSLPDTPKDWVWNLGWSLMKNVYLIISQTIRHIHQIMIVEKGMVKRDHRPYMEVSNWHESCMFIGNICYLNIYKVLFILYLFILLNIAVINKCGPLNLNGFHIFDKEKRLYYIQNTKKLVPTMNTGGYFMYKNLSKKSNKEYTASMILL